MRGNQKERRKKKLAFHLDGQKSTRVKVESYRDQDTNVKTFHPETTHKRANTYTYI